MTLGATIFKPHIKVKTDKIIASEAPINPSKYTEVPYLTMMSNIKREGTTDANKYMLR